MGARSAVNGFLVIEKQVDFMWNDPTAVLPTFLRNNVDDIPISFIQIFIIKDIENTNFIVKPSKIRLAKETQANLE